MVSIVAQNGRKTYNVKAVIINTDDEVETLSTKVAPGSTAYVTESGNRYILDNSKNWVLYKGASGSGGGSGSGSGGGSGSGSGSGCGCVFPLTEEEVNTLISGGTISSDGEGHSALTEEEINELTK